jgi:hypothetical protein
MKNEMTTLSRVMSVLRERGYTEDFNLKQDYIECPGGKCTMYPEDFNIDDVYRFEGDSDPGDQAILYAISSEKFGVKGMLVNGYGLSSEPMSHHMIKKLKMPGGSR